MTISGLPEAWGESIWHDYAAQAATANGYVAFHWLCTGYVLPPQLCFGGSGSGREKALTPAIFRGYSRSNEADASTFTGSGHESEPLQQLDYSAFQV